MNCPKCGNFLPQGAQFCSVCNEPLGSPGYNPYGQTQPGAQTPGQGYAQTYQPEGGYYPPAQGYSAPAPYPPAPGYSAPAQGQAPLQGQYPPQPQPQEAPYAQQSYPPGYQQVYSGGGYYAPQQKQGGAFLAALLRLPGLLLQSFRDPVGVLQGIVERKELSTPPVVCALSLLLAFLCALTSTRGLVAGFISALASILGGSAASADGISSIAGGIASSVGGIAALCQLLAILLPLSVLLCYVCAVRKVRFSLELAFGMALTLTLPTLPLSLLTLLAGFLSPALALLFVICAMAVSYVSMGTLAARVTGQNESEMMPARILLTLISLALTLFLSALMIWLLSGGVISGVLARFGIR